MGLSSKIKVAVLRGGPSSEYDVSLKTGQNIISLLQEMSERYEPIDIFISRNGEWHREGLVGEPYKILRHVGTVWNALHGHYGEDGQVQKVLESLQIPFTGSGSVAAALSINKEMAKRIYQKHGLRTPAYEFLTPENFSEDKLAVIFRNYLHPVIVKPSNGSGSFSVHVAHAFHELKEAIKSVFEHTPRILIEEFVDGNEASCVVIEGGRGEKFYTLPPISQDKFKLKIEENKEIENMARIAHEALGLRHYSNSDFIITPKGKVYILETNTLPKFYENSPMHKSLQTTGWHSRDFVDHVLKLL